jgi:hypothetical protein
MSSVLSSSNDSDSYVRDSTRLSFFAKQGNSSATCLTILRMFSASDVMQLKALYISPTMPSLGITNPVFAVNVYFRLLVLKYSGYSE